MPSELHNLTAEDINDIGQYYAMDMPSNSYYRQEVDLWKTFWSTEQNKPSSLSDTLNRSLQQRLFPNITQILRLLLMVPVSAASSERAHSVLKKTKNKHRNTMSEDRMNALTLLFIHKDIALNYEHVIDIFAKKHPRKMLLLNPLE